MAQEFKKGDIVNLKSGGPDMTVEGYKAIINLSGPPTEDKSKVKVSWFTQDKLTRETFDVEALELAED